MPGDGDDGTTSAGDDSPAAADAPMVDASAGVMVAVETASAPDSKQKNLAKHIEGLKKQAADMRAATLKLAKELKNAQRRKCRLKPKVRALTDEDLLAVLLMRRDAQQEGSEASSGTAGTSSSPSSGPAPAPGS